jgi:hypothetical protein
MSTTFEHGGWRHRSPVGRALRIAGLVVLGVVGAALFALAFGWLVMIIWNWVMPPVFGLGAIGYWQAFGIVILAKLIFGGVGGARHHGPLHNPWRGNPWKGNPWGEGSHGRRMDDWRHYREYWDAEGREAFESFMRRKRGSAEPEAGTGKA